MVFDYVQLSSTDSKEACFINNLTRSHTSSLCYYCRRTLSSERLLTIAADAFVGVVQCPSATSDVWAGFAPVVVSSYSSVQIVAACVRAIWRFHYQIRDNWIVGRILTAVVNVVCVGLVTATAVVYCQTTFDSVEI